MAHQTRVRSGEEYNNNNNNNNNEQEDSNAPRGINRLSSRTWPSPLATSHQSISVVADLLQNESVTSLVQKRKEKQGEDSGLESGHTSMNTGKYYETQIVADLSPPSLQPRTLSQTATLLARTLTLRSLSGPPSTQPGTQTSVSNSTM